MKRILSVLILSFITLTCVGQNKIIIKLSEEFKGPYTGRLMVFTQPDTSKPFGQAKEGPAFAIMVKNWKNGETQTLTNSAMSLTKPLDSVASGYYKFVAILDTNTKERGNNAPGNLYTRREVISLVNSGQANPTELTLTHIFTARKFNETDSIKEVTLKSERLTKFRREPIFFKAGVALPPSYFKEPNRLFPVVYVIPGWGGTHHHAYNKGQRNSYGVGLGEEKIYVFLNPETQTPYGLHAFVDSKVNGPWGTALVNELMPYITRQFRASPFVNQTFITGQSSGGYGAIWLTLNFPKKFGGCWATSPDPIDFSNFTGVDIYKEQNFYQNSQGKEREIFYVNGKATSTLRQMFMKEEFEGDGGQQQSFEAEFGLPDQNGRPQALFNSKTGTINKKVSQNWRSYDLVAYVLDNWSKIKNDASGKIRIYAGEKDNFLLQESVIAFRNKIEKIKADIKVEVIKDADHFNTRSAALTKKIQSEMDSISKSKTEE